MSLKKTLPAPSTAGPSRKEITAAGAGATSFATRPAGGGILPRSLCCAVKTAAAASKTTNNDKSLVMGKLAWGCTWAGTKIASKRVGVMREMLRFIVCLVYRLRKRGKNCAKLRTEESHRHRLIITYSQAQKWHCSCRLTYDKLGP